VIHEVDSALRALIERETGTRDVEVVFDAPTREWAGRRNSPTIDVYLYDIREDMRRRARGLINEYDERNLRVVARHLPPRYFKLSYLVTAWTQRPEDEHRLLSSLLSCFLRFEALPTDLLTGPLLELGVDVPVTVALPPPEDRAFADVWSALGGELKPSIDLVISAPVDTGQRFEAGPPVSVPPTLTIGGNDGWPEIEETGGIAVSRPRGTAARAAAERAEAEADGNPVGGPRGQAARAAAEHAEAEADGISLGRPRRSAARATGERPAAEAQGTGAEGGGPAEGGGKAAGGRTQKTPRIRMQVARRRTPPKSPS
jgi:hypothetical protein